MKVSKVRVKSFKGIVDVEIELTDVTLIVGANNSGKSSFLQAVHFSSRCIAQASEANKQSTLSLREVEYIPSQVYSELAYNDRWGNRYDQPESVVNFTLENITENMEMVDYYNANVCLKSARNEGISVNPTIDNNIINIVRNKSTLFSAYIPGLAGIPLEESFLSKRHVYRKAASGDSNVVLRNILYLLKREKQLENTINDIRDLYDDPKLDITVEFSNNIDYFINANIKTKGMFFYKPIELAGTGIIQALQIFSYLYLFRPKLILIDEPEAHLHPPLQTRLIEILQKAVAKCGSRALITTHSPFIAAGLSDGASTVWLESGRLAAVTKTRTIRDALGWGALDKKIIVCAEDNDTSLLGNILKQDSRLSREVAIMPFSGVTKLGTAEALLAFRAALGNKHKIMIYRDRDCMTDAELDKWFNEYENAGFGRLVPSGVEIENEYVNSGLLSVVLDVPWDEASKLIEEIYKQNEPEISAKFRSKRQEVISRYYKDGGSPATKDLWDQLPNDRKSSGKFISKKINELIQNNGIGNTSILSGSPKCSVGIELLSQLRAFSATNPGDA